MLNRTIIVTTAVALLLGRDGRLAETGLLVSVPSAEQIEDLLAAN